MHLFVEQLGDVDKSVADRAELVGATSGVEQDRLGDAEVDTFEKTDVADVLPAAFADNRENANVVAVAAPPRQVIRDRQVSRVDVARNDCDRIGIDPVAYRTEIWL